MSFLGLLLFFLSVFSIGLIISTYSAVSAVEAEVTGKIRGISYIDKVEEVRIQYLCIFR